MRIRWLFLIIVLSSIGVFSQQPLDELSPKLRITKPECPINSDFIYSIDSSSEVNDVIIIISHRGKSETGKMDVRRLYNARTFLSMSLKGRSPQRVFAAVGERSEDKGFLDFFVTGRLELRIFFPKNKDLTVQPCFEDPEQVPCTGEFGRLYYPCRVPRERALIVEAWKRSWQLSKKSAELE